MEKSNELRGKIDELRGKNNELEEKIKIEDLKNLADLDNFSLESKDEKELKQENEKLLDLVSSLTSELEKNKNETDFFLRENKSLQKEIQKIKKLTLAFENLKNANSEQTEAISTLKKELEYYKKRVYDDDSLFGANNIENENFEYKKQIDSLIIENSSLKQENKIFLENQKEKSEIIIEKEDKKSTELKKDILIDKLENFISKLEKKI